MVNSIRVAVNKLHKGDNEKLLFSTTVFSLVAILKSENLTEEGYFDFSKIPNLRVLDNGFLRILRKKYEKTQAEMAKLIRVPLRTWVGWESYGKFIPFEKLYLLANKLHIKNSEFYNLIRNTKFTYGLHHGKNKMSLSLKPSEFVLANYVMPIKPDKAYLIKGSPENVKYYILKNFSIDKSYFKKTGSIVIYSYLLNRFLRTFYNYEKKIRLAFPLSVESKKLIGDGVNLTKAVLIPLALSDGGEKPGKRLFFSGTSKQVHDVWSDAFNIEYGLLPSSYLLQYKSIFVTTHIIPSNVYREIKKVCPNFKTSPIKQSKEDYLKLPQPSIEYLFDSKTSEQQVALRLWATTEGSIGINLDKRKGLIYPIFKIACAHPVLIEQLQRLGGLNGINFHVKKEVKNWSGLSALETFSLSSSLSFLKMGGFFDVDIAKSRSPYFGGLKKQDVLLGILEFMHRQREEKIRFTNKILAYKGIASIVKEKSFKDADHYLNVFKTKKR